MKQKISSLYRRPLMRAFFLCLVCITTSCTYLKREPRNLIIENGKIPQIQNHDYRDHLASLSDSLIKNKTIKVINIDGKVKNYLKEIFNIIVSNNELLLKKQVEFEPQFFIIDNDMPFVFSLPKNQFFISRGLIKKYFKNESMLICALAYEIIKSKREIYYKTKIIPTGVMDVQRLI